MINDHDIENLVGLFSSREHDFKIFMRGVVEYIGEHPSLNVRGKEIVHSYKSRVKDKDHLRKKIERKISKGRSINENNMFEEITDLAGVRIIHLFQDDFSYIDRVIRQKISSGDWVLGEKPVANTWDPEAAEYFGGFDLEVKQRPTHYTSVHYLVRPRVDSPLCCEIQVRTLFEEIWGEVDHRINYPVPTENLACREQIKVLSKIVGAGSRLLDSLNRVRELEG